MLESRLKHTIDLNFRTTEFIHDTLPGQTLPAGRSESQVMFWLGMVPAHPLKTIRAHDSAISII